MSSGKLPITVAIPVKNESSNLGRCLSRLTEFESVVVIDSSSTDQTPEIARSHGARVLNFEWDGGYPKKRNWFLTTQAVGTPWVLFLDADEFVTEEFCRAARAAISQFLGVLAELRELFPRTQTSAWGAAAKARLVSRWFRSL